MTVCDHCRAECDNCCDECGGDTCDFHLEQCKCGGHYCPNCIGKHGVTSWEGKIRVYDPCEYISISKEAN